MPHITLIIDDIFPNIVHVHYVIRVTLTKSKMRNYRTSKYPRKFQNNVTTDPNSLTASKWNHPAIYSLASLQCLLKRPRKRNSPVRGGIAANVSRGCQSWKADVGKSIRSSCRWKRGAHLRLIGTSITDAGDTTRKKWRVHVKSHYGWGIAPASSARNSRYRSTGSGSFQNLGTRRRTTKFNANRPAYIANTNGCIVVVDEARWHRRVQQRDWYTIARVRRAHTRLLAPLV